MTPSQHQVPPESLLLRTARDQFGLLARAQILALGFSADWIKRRVQRGELQRVYPGVHLMPAVPPSPEQELMAVVLWAGRGVIVSHRSAAVLLGLDGVDDHVVELTVSRALRPPGPGVILHRTHNMPRFDRSLVGPLPVTTAARTLIDIGDQVDEETVEIALDSALRVGLTSVPRLQWRLEQFQTRGRRGPAVLINLLGYRAPGEKPAASAHETRVWRTIRDSDLPRPVRQHPVRVGRRTRHIDIAYPRRLLGIECHSYKHHSGYLAWEGDVERDEELRELGWRILYVTPRQLRRDPSLVVGRIRKALMDSPAQ